MKKALAIKIALLVFFCISFCSNQLYSQDKQSLLEHFKNPPNSAQPRVWWHWMNGNITKDGIAKDLEWMHRIGIGGFQNFDASLMTPQVVKKRLMFMTPEWKDAFRFTTVLADSLGLEMGIAGSPGWSESGGPWVQPQDGMKKYVWTETLVKGGEPFHAKIEQPSSVTGRMQNVPFKSDLSLSDKASELPEFYKDVVVIAYKLPDNERSIKELKPEITSSGGDFNLEQLTDSDLATSLNLPAEKVGEYAWVQYSFNEPITIRSLIIAGGGNQGLFSRDTTITRNLEISNDGKNFTKALDLPLGRMMQKTFSFAPIEAKFFRFNFLTQENSQNPIAAMMGAPMPAKDPLPIPVYEIDLKTTTSVEAFEEKAAFEIGTDLYHKNTPEAQDPIALNNVIDLTSKLDKNGVLQWDPPAGNWRILRFGYSLIGVENHPASPEATGLEVDKLDPKAVKAYIETYLDMYKDATGGLIGDKGLQYITTDSWEAEAQNWTDNMMEEFQKRRGYSMIPWMPVLTGKIVESSSQSDEFLWDFRKTLSEMLKEYHYDVLTTALHARKMGRYTESHESGRAFIGDGMAVKSTADIPMSAMWVPGGLGASSTGGPEVRHEADIRESASVAHIYGQNLVAAESLTAIGNAWGYSPENLKPTADMELASGLNRFVIHTSVHQPLDNKIPGIGLGPFGQWFTRHDTWAEEATPWVSYLSRSSYLLQQGKFVADVVYYYGDDSNITALFGDSLPEIPKGYEYDFINTEALTKLLSVKDKHFITPSGMSYNVLVLDKNSSYMTLKVLKTIRDLVNSGGVVVGQKPKGTPSLQDDKNEFNAVVNQLWETKKENVLAQESLDEVLNNLSIVPDFKYKKDRAEDDIRYVHRRLDSMEVYWINNRNSYPQDIEASFRVEGKIAELWNPETGETKKISYRIGNGITKVPLHLDAYDAYFVVFKDTANEKEYITQKKSTTKVASLEGSWSLSFEPDRGAPESTVINGLSSWTESKVPGIRYFSGTATYKKDINMQKDWLAEDSELWLDLGKVKNIAEVIINGKPVSILWIAPFAVNITKALKKGKNTLEIKVTNLWVNRLIGDQQPDVKHKITYTTMPFYQSDSPLLPSGLLGPISLIQKQ
ncbi:MAG: glycosyl hydrolase [Leeuwenhoekiella sp.]